MPTPELDAETLYLLLALTAVRDQQIDDLEHELLSRFAHRLRIGRRRAEALLARARRAEEDGILLDEGPLDPSLTFERAAMLALEDGRITATESKLLDVCRRLLELPEPHADMIRRDLEARRERSGDLQSGG